MTQPSADYLASSNPYNYDQPLPPLARMNAVTQVPPAKKITFYKSGDPQFGGVKMAINQRSFKSFNALMDDLSHRVPLPFGVRTITTPRGIHCISTLDQLEDGGCYLCSDKKYVTPISIGTANRRTGPQKTGRPASALRRAAQDGKHDDYSTGFTQQSPRIPKKVTLVKNGDITTQRPIILNRRNARSLKTLLDEISEVMQFTVKKLFTLDGRKIDNMQALLHCPNVLVCVGREPFKPIMKENARKHSSEKLPGLASRSSINNNGENQEMNFGLEAKKSVMHPRSSLSNRSARFSLSSEKSSTNGLAASPDNGAPFPRNCPHSKAGDLGHSLVNDDIEKKVHVNKDGSLSVEMKVRFRLLNDETLQWSTQIKKSSLMNKTPCEELSINHDNGLELLENPEESSELDDSLYPCDADSYMSNLDESENDEARCHKCGKLCKDYDIWKNPLHTSQKEEPAVKSTWYTHSSCSSTSSHRRIVRKKVASVDSIRTSSSGEEYSKHVVRESSHYSETVENTVEYHSVKNCCCQHGCVQTDTSQRGSPEDMDAIANSASSQNKEETTVEGGGDEGKRSRPGSSKSKSSQCSAESQIRVCEETSSLARTISSSSVKERGEAEDAVVCSSPPNSVYSKSSKASKLGRAKENADEVSENDQVISSFSTDSCPKKDAAEEEAGKEDEEINEIYSVSENPASNPSVKDEVSECGRCSTARSFGSESCAGNNQRSDSDEKHMCSAASASSRNSKRSKRSQNHLEVASNRSVASSRGSTSSKKKKKSKSSLHAEDARSNSKASNYSKSSHEVERRDSGGHSSQDSSPPHSHVSSLSEGVAPPAYNDESTSSISKCYSKSSKNSQKKDQADNSSKLSSPCSSFSDWGGENGNRTPKVSSPEDSSRLGSVSESTCSKCGHVTKPGRDDLRSASSRVSSYSEVKSRYAETEASRRSDDACSQSSVAVSSKPRRKKTSSLQTDVERCSQVSAPKSASMYSFHCPAPPKGRPSSRKSRTVLLKKSSKGTSACTESELITDKEEKEATASQPPEIEVVHPPEPLNTEKESRQEEAQEEAETEPSAPDGGDGMIPSSLPNASLEDVVHEWLRKIPSEPLLMKCEMQDDGEGVELDAEMPGSSNSQELLEADSEEKKEETKDAESTADAAEAATEGAEDEAVDEEPKEDLSEEKASEAVLEETEAGEAKCNHSVLSSQNNHKKDLPNTIQTSVQIMKALLASKEPKMDRSHSLPEVSPTMGRKLSDSANVLITCLASLQLLDEELDPSSKSKKRLNRPRYTELLNIFQALWCGCTSEKGGPSSGMEEESQAKVPSGFKGHCSKEGDFTPMSSSGVDVSSGDGGSGEGSVAGGRDRALSQEKTEEAKPTEEDAENTEVETGNEGDQGEASQPPTPRSKSEGGEEVESAGGEEPAEADSCETGLEGEKEIAEEEEMEENSKQENENVECEEMGADGDTTQVEAQEDSVVKEVEDSPHQEDAGKVTEEPSNHEATEEPSPNDPSTKENNDMEEPETRRAQQQVGMAADDTQPSSDIIPRQPSVKVPPMVPQRSIDPDPVWVLKLLKKIEKEFMTHYVNAMNEFKVKWNLPNTNEVNVMISELKEEVSTRIQKSIEKELKKIRSRAGRRIPRPPDEELRRESTLQVENRRRRLQSIRKMSLYNDRNTNQSNQQETRELSYEIDEDFIFSTIRDDDSELPSEEEYCPCDACIRKKMEARAIRGPVFPPVAANAPVVKAFDLQQILKMKKSSVPEMMVAHSIAEEEGQVEEAGAETAESEANQQAEAGGEKEVGETTEKEEEGEGEVAEDEAEALLDREEVSENQNCEEAAEGEATNAEAEEEAKEEMGEEEDEGRKEEVEEEVAEEGEKEEEVGEKAEEEEEDENEEEEVDVKVEEEEEEVGEGEGDGKEEEESVKEEEKEEEEREAAEEEEESAKEEEKEEKEAEGEELEAEEEKEEKETEEEEVGAGEEKEEQSVKEEEEEKEEEKEEKSMEEEAEEGAGEEKEEGMDEEGEGEGEAAQDEMEEEKEEKSVEEEEEEDVGDEKEEGMNEEEEGEGEAAQDEMEEEKEEKSVEEEEEEEEKVEEEGEAGGGGEVAHEGDDQEVEDKSEGEKERNEEEEEKDLDEEQEEETQQEDQEAEEEPKTEGETDEAAAEPEAGEGESQKDASECVENAGDAGGSEAEAAEKENEIEEDAQASGGEVEENDEANLEVDFEARSETAAEEGENVEGDGEAGEEADEAEGEEINEPGQADGDEEDPATAPEEEEDDGGEPSEAIKNLRKASAISSMGNCSQQSQKGSEDGNDGEDCKEEDDMDKEGNAEEGAKSNAEDKPATMYPDTEEEDEEDRASSPGSGGKGQEAKTDENEENNSQVSKKKDENLEAIDQDDLDF